LAIAIPFFLFMAIVVGANGGIVTVITLGVLLVFIWLGSRDLTRAYRTLQDAERTRAALGVPQAEQWEEPSSSQGDRAPASVTEHTTYPLPGERDSGA
jgi:hypothetical protein